MHISVKETTIFSVFHPDAQDLYNTCSDLKKVIWELWDPSFRLNDEVSRRHLDITSPTHIIRIMKNKNVQLFHAFAPMLCKRPTKKIEDTVKEMGGSEFIIEEKLDGERIQLHKRSNEYFYCSRYVVPLLSIFFYLTHHQEGERLHVPIRQTCWYRKFDTIHRRGLRPPRRRVRFYSEVKAIDINANFKNYFGWRNAGVGPRL